MPCWNGTVWKPRAIAFKRALKEQNNQQAETLREHAKSKIEDAQRHGVRKVSSRNNEHFKFGGSVKSKNSILILLNVLEGPECVAKRLGLAPIRGEEPSRDDEGLRGTFRAVFQEGCSDANLEQNLHLTT